MKLIQPCALIEKNLNKPYTTWVTFMFTNCNKKSHYSNLCYNFKSLVLVGDSCFGEFFPDNRLLLWKPKDKKVAVEDIQIE